jgi:L-alanine-DL-glutamate epimerase-like enolase superfamily enzyme
MSRTFDSLADLSLHIEAHRFEPHERPVSPQWSRLTTVIALEGEGHTGLGEDVIWDEADQRALRAHGDTLELAGEYTLASFSAHLDGIDLFPGGGPSRADYVHYRRWALESAALDLALRQNGRSLGEALGREPRPVRFVASVRFEGDIAPISDRLEAYPGAGFKLDPEPGWTPEVIEALAATGAVHVLDYKGLYRGTPVDVPTDPELYRRTAEAFADAWLEDPDLSVADADEVLRAHRDRITWDYPIHAVADVEALDFAPRALNCKPSRFGSVAALMDFYDFCEREGIALYGGGQSELSIGRGQIQLLAALFHPDGPNDVAPAGWDQPDWASTQLPASPLDPAPDHLGFRRREGA